MERVSVDDFNFLDPAEKSKNLLEKKLLADGTGVPGIPGPCYWHFKCLAGQLTLFQPWGAGFAHHIIICTPNIYDLTSCMLTKLEKVALLFYFLLQSKPAKPKVEKSGLDM